MGIARKFMKNSVYYTAANLASKAAALFLAVYLTTLLSTSEFGTYSWIVMMVVIADVLASYGTGNTLAKFISDALAVNDGNRARAYFRYLLKKRLRTLVVVAGALFIFADFIAALVFGKAFLSTPLRAVGVLLIAYNAVGYLQAQFVALQQNKHFFWSSAISGLIKVVLSVWLVMLTGSLYGAVLAYIIALSVGAVYMAVVLYRKGWFKKSSETAVEKSRIDPYIRYATMGSVLLIMLTCIDSIVVSMVLPMDSVGFYRIAIAWSSVVMGFIPAYLTFPVLSELAAKSDRNLQDAFGGFSKYLLVLTTPVGFAMAISANAIISFFYSAAYLPAVPLLMVFAALIILNPLLVLFISILSAVERVYVNAAVLGAGTVLLAALGFVAGGMFGTMGVAAASVFTYAVVCIALGWAVLAIKKICITPSALYKPIISAVVSFGGFLLLPWAASPVTAAAYVIFGFVLYFLLLIAMKHLTFGEILRLKSRILSRD